MGYPSSIAPIKISNLKASTRFSSNHILGEESFSGVSKAMNTEMNQKVAAIINEKVNFRPDVARNTLIRKSDFESLNPAEAIDTGKTYSGSPILRTSEPVDLVVVDHLQHGPGAQVQYLRLSHSEQNIILDNEGLILMKWKKLSTICKKIYESSPKSTPR